MFRKLSYKITALIIALLFAIIGSVAAIYIANCRSLYIKHEIGMMSRAYDKLARFNFNNRNKIDDFFEMYGDQEYTVIICNSDFERIYSSKKNTNSLRAKESWIKKNAKLFTEDARPQYISNENVSDIISLQRKLKKDGTYYYIYIHESLKTVDAVFSYANLLMLVMLCVFLGSSACCMFILVNRSIRPVSQISDIANEIAKNNYSVRYTGKMPNNEIGTLAKSVNRMADKIEENTSRLKNYNFLLKEDIKRLNEYEEMRKRVISNITHELKTPLAIISSQIEMMSCVDNEEKRSAYYDSAMKEIDKMSALISRALNFSAGEKEIFGGEKQSVNLSEYISTLVSDISTFLYTKNVKYISHIEPGCSIEIVPNHIDHIFNNYIMNAARYVLNGGRVIIKLEKLDAKYRFSVYNDGEPMKDGNLNKVWTDFYKLDDSNSELSVGLGLFIVKEISIIDRADCGVENKDNGVEFWYDFLQ